MARSLTVAVLTLFRRFLDLSAPFGGLFGVAPALFGGVPHKSFLFVFFQELRAGDPGLGANGTQG